MHCYMKGSSYHSAVAVMQVPFDHTKPAATLKARAKLVTDKNPKGYPHGVVPDGPIPPSMTTGSLFEVDGARRVTGVDDI